MARVRPFDDYVALLGRLTSHVDPTAASASATDIKEAADSLANLDEVDLESLTRWILDHPEWVPALGLTVGLGQEKLRNALKHRFGSAGWIGLGRTRPAELAAMLDEEFDLVRLLRLQRHREYDFGDILVARAGTRTTATRAGAAGRRVENEIEAIARDLGLDYMVRTRFEGRGGRTAPCDLAVTADGQVLVAVAAKGFDSTGSKLTDAVREIEEMADVRLPRQFVLAVIDGIGWKSRISDLRRIHELWRSDQIDGMYNLSTLDDFRNDLQQFAWLRGLIER